MKKVSLLALAVFISSVSFSQTVYLNTDAILINTYTSDGSKLQVTGASSFNGAVRFQGLTGNSNSNKVLVADDNGWVFYRNLSTLQGNAGWTMSGNAGSSEVTNFIGTTDNQPVVFRTNNTETMRILANGNIGVGISSPTSKFEVNGIIRAKKVIVTQSTWPDYVFETSYKLPSLESVSSFIKANKHLPEMPSASAIEKDGQDVGDIQKLLLKKVEELTLYVIEQQKEIQLLKERNEKLENAIEQDSKKNR